MRGTTQMMGRALVGALVLAWIATAGWSQSLTWLGTLPGGNWSEAWGVSADGAVVVGSAVNFAGYGRAFRWTESGGMEDLNTTYASLLTNGSELRSATLR
jgi:probable HAF family extracellular repeat protein